MSPAFCLLASQTPYLLRTGLPAGLGAHFQLLIKLHMCHNGGSAADWLPAGLQTPACPVCHLELCVHLEPSVLASESASSLWSFNCNISFKGVCEGPGPVLSIGEALDK